jgi:hypothetical protein
MKLTRSIPFVLSLVLIFAGIPAHATESRIIGGDGLVGDGVIASSVWKIGLCPITAGQDFGYHVSETANSAWPGAFGQSGAFRIVHVPDVNPSTLTPSDIINLGEQYDVDALLWGSVDQAKNRRSLWGSATNPQNEVAVTITFKMYETTTGNLLWERMLKKDRTVSASEAEGIVERFAGNIVTDMVGILINDGITGRDLSLNAAPVFEFPFRTIYCRTSAFRLEGMVTDDFGINEVTLSCGGSEAIRSWPLEQASEFPVDTVVACDEVTGDELTIVACDSQGVISQMVLALDFSGKGLEGAIANISADSVFLNIGSDDGVGQGMVFSVETPVEIVDPETGSILGTTSLKTGMIEVTSVEAQFCTCRVIEGKIEDMNSGDRVY